MIGSAAAAPEPSEFPATALIVVGVDGSLPSQVALRWALAEAACRDAPIEVVRAFDVSHDWPAVCGVPPLTLAEVAAVLEANVRAVVRSVVAEDGPELAGVPVEVVALPGAPGEVLVRRAQRADLLVVGHRGLGSSELLGSVGLHCVLHAPCSVTIARQVGGRAGTSPGSGRGEGSRTVAASGHR